MNSKQPSTEQNSSQRIDTINQVFALFRINYHNQYYSAFTDTSLLNQTKKLWLESLSGFSSEAILMGAKRAMENSDYIPTLHKMIQFCQGDPNSHGLPDPHQAYLEACRAPRPKNTHAWSHPAVYFAGKESDWYFLSTTPEYVAYPIFKENYKRWQDKVINGEKLPTIEVKMIAAETHTPLSNQENRERLRSLREKIKI
ncbi:replication protein P [Aurantivibrio infirmus]